MTLDPKKPEQRGSIESHYERSWGRRWVPHVWRRGPFDQLPESFKVLEFEPRSKQDLWKYATAGLADSPASPRIELHFLSPQNSLLLVELLTVIAHEHATGSSLGVGHTVNFGRPWLPNSTCSRGLISLPYPFGPSLEHFDGQGDRVRCLWVLPITEAEVDFANEHGVEALEQRFDQAPLQYWDVRRPTVI